MRLAGKFEKFRGCGVGDAARNLREISKEAQLSWVDVLQNLQSVAVSRLEALSGHVPFESERFSEARKNLSGTFDRFSRIMEMIYHFRGSAGYFHQEQTEPLFYCRMQDSVQEVLHAMSYELSFTNITILKIIPHDLIPIRIPSEHLDMILFQLIDNARRTLRGLAGIITIEAQDEIVSSPEHTTGRRLRLRVSDTGPGLPIADLPYLFEPFYPGTREHSTGLGLFTVKKIAELHSGSIRVESSTRGTSFFLELPV